MELYGSVKYFRIKLARVALKNYASSRSTEVNRGKREYGEKLKIFLIFNYFEKKNDYRRALKAITAHKPTDCFAFFS